jgi:anti-sigma-K factor RskA
MSDHMSDPPPGAPPGDRDLLAASYALGVLDRAEAEAVVAEAARDPALRAAIDAWDARLAPLAAIVPPAAPPPELWSRIAASAGLGAMGPAGVSRPGAFRRAWHSAPFWRATTAAALAIAAAFAGVAWLRPAPSPETLAAALAPPGVPSAVFLAEVQPDGQVRIRALSPVSVQSGKSLELWALPAGATQPVSLGVLPPIGRNLPARALLAAQTQLMISLEPEGGSTTGAPTGPVLWGGRLAPIQQD